MKVEALAIPEVLVITPPRFGDDRGYFQVLYEARAYAEIGLTNPFVQDNASFSARGVLRGLHWQIPNPQGKLVQALTGEVWDVAVDIRQGSPTFGHWVASTLTSQVGNQIWVPPGFAHGFLVLSETALVAYKNTTAYEPQGQCSLRWDDPRFGIEWPDLGMAPTLSPKDEAGWTTDTVPPAMWPQF
ncbi:MAG TPA: dTDP-4-dehydrorhamnose 3,5-epimerase [Fimbriimonadaceae bacterium]|nr:dTDP-4-dehydrorhamnose 3,5-epimerase [Armatimonadota bacterium]HCM73633.1 dTDP-4-dehydrorhamnose 3,5-epimerase [Armatimonadota bacterium]HRD32043.1 dTDP-4-dehydrorhamnose 3,5-epimerase [Fimbriimonadaceae bacterium]HRE93699.1 dTDP-4-dehydrorhamnose 3,5-epimerase [Fimbriimonadaceae bacterium]HRI74033.1 dTDP-4-dehydrorhamnose 3,5-epimerase [Fimbriimonadaceae bacterium]